MRCHTLKNELTVGVCQWFRAPNGFAGHVANAFEDSEGTIVLQMAYSKDNVFWWWADKDGKAPAPTEIRCDLVSWKIDYESEDLDLKMDQLLVKGDMEFPRIDDRFSTTPHTVTLFNLMDHSAGTDWRVIGPVLGGGHPIYNCIAMYNSASRKQVQYFVGPHKFCQECVFIPRSKDAQEADGYVMALLNNYADMTSELVILNTNDLTKEVALVKLPLRLRAGLHGNWVDDQDTDGHPELPTNRVTDDELKAAIISAV